MSKKNHKISLEVFAASLNLKSSLKPKELEAVICELFVHIRTNTECGLWVEVEGFGSFHPLWYNIKKHKDINEDQRIVQEMTIESAKREQEKKIEKSRALKGVVLIVTLLSIGILLFKERDSLSQKHEANLTKEKSYQNFKVFEPHEKATAKPFYYHRISKGDNLYRLAQKLYSDAKYWPLIYAQNSKKIHDMDKIYPNDILKIPRIANGSTAQESLTKVYIKAYQRYKKLGKTDKARWLLYWGHQNIDDDLLETFHQEIEGDDLEKVREYIQRFKKIK